MWVVVINTPGYLPESEPVEFETLAEAQEYAAYEAEDWAEGVEGVASRESDTLWRIEVERDLDRVVEVIEVFPEVDEGVVSLD